MGVIRVSMAVPLTCRKCRELKEKLLWVRINSVSWRRNRVDGWVSVARMELSRNAYRVLVGRPEWKRHLGRPQHRWEDNIKMDLREVG